jgi:hypothetical protein
MSAVLRPIPLVMLFQVSAKLRTYQTSITLVLRLNQKVHRVKASPSPSTASEQGLLGNPMNLLSVSEH